jgi:hypothetical protein
MLPEVWIVKGDLLRALAPDDARGGADAEPLYRKALDRATELDARMAQLRAATRLARLRAADGDPAAASAVLAPILGTFTEGFETADVREARDLLEAVAIP